MTDHEAYIALNLLSGIGSVTVDAAIKRFGSAAAIFTAPADELVQIPGIGPARASMFATLAPQIKWREEIARAEAQQTRLVTLADDNYPVALRSIHSAPLVLYVVGDYEGCIAQPCAGVVGTRTPSQYGTNNARDFSYGLAIAGVTVVSGLARGIDTSAARGALLARGRTIAVIGSALDQLYPQENRPLAHEIIENGGCVMSEYPFGMKANKQTFPMRNRIIAGLSKAVLCVEGARQSGTMITARQAMESGRSVLAIPGPIDDPRAEGCNKLIKDGARLAESAADVLDEMGLGASAMQEGDLFRSERVEASAPRGKNVMDALLARATPEEQRIIQFIGRGSKSADEIARELNIDAASILTLLFHLQMKSLLQQKADNTYCVCL